MTARGRAKKPSTELQPSTSTMEIGAALTDPNIFEPWFCGPSWDGWRAVLRGAFGEKMTKSEKAFFRTVASRDPPAGRVKEWWIIAGRRAGKDSIASASGAHMAANFQSNGRLRPGERALVACLAVDRAQAATVLNYTRAFFQKVPALAALVQRETADGFELNNGADIAIVTTDYRAVRGRTILCCIFDEVAFWKSESSIATDREVYRSLRPGMATLAESMLIGITTAHRRNGLAYERWQQHFGRDSSKVLVIHAKSRALNPTLSQADIDEALAEDPQAARADYLSIWRDDLSSYVTRELIESAVDQGVTVRPYNPRHQYVGFIDASSGTFDAFACAIAHKEGDVAILDCLVEILAPFNTAVATAQIAEVLKSYGCRSVMGDDHAKGWVRAELARHGVALLPRPNGMDGSVFHLEVLPLFGSGRARLLANARLVGQYCALERRPRGEREWVGHPTHAHDDLAVVCSGALWRASRSAGSLWGTEHFLIDGRPAEFPSFVFCLYVVLVGDDRGELGVAFFQAARDPKGGQVLYLIDADVKSQAPQTFRDIWLRMEELFRQTRTIEGRVYAQAVIAEQLDRVLGRNINAQRLDGVLVTDLGLTAALHIAGGEVKVVAGVLAKPIGLGFLDGTPGRDDDVLRNAVLAGIVIGFHGVPVVPRRSPNANLPNCL